MCIIFEMVKKQCHSTDCLGECCTSKVPSLLHRNTTKVPSLLHRNTTKVPSLLHRNTTNKQTVFSARQPPSGPRLPHCRGFMIKFRNTTIGRTSLDERSARRWDLNLTTRNTHNRQPSMPPAGFEPAIPRSKRPQTHILDRAATWVEEIQLHCS